jgi:hypothetical protein
MTLATIQNYAFVRDDHIADGFTQHKEYLCDHRGQHSISGLQPTLVPRRVRNIRLGGMILLSTFRRNEARTEQDDAHLEDYS